MISPVVARQYNSTSLTTIPLNINLEIYLKQKTNNDNQYSRLKKTIILRKIRLFEISVTTYVSIFIVLSNEIIKFYKKKITPNK